MPAVATSRPELLAPAGDFDAMRAAVINGADAVYFGLSDFNARHRAANFTLDELPRTVEYLHSHNVRGYVTVNTLIFSDELPAISEYITRIAESGIDAVIVQDMGLVRLIKRIAPTLPVHGSTQMTLTEPRGIEFVRSLGVERVILARESSLDDIRRIREQSPMPVEVFVHGALCISYSGQCLTSEALGGRSANRGQCAQACRLPYELIVDGDAKPLGDQAYLLSPLDLAAADLIGELTDLGVVSFKIEGRLKSPQYVAATTQTYRAAVDAASRGQRFTPTAQQQFDLQQSFSRGFSHGFFDGVDHSQLVPARFPKHRGVKAGVVKSVTCEGVMITCEHGVELKLGDGVVFDEGHPEQDEQGGRVSAVRVVSEMNAGGGARPQAAMITFHHGSVNLGAISVGAIVWRTDDPAIRKRLEHSFSRDQVVHRRKVDVHIVGSAGEPLVLTFREGSGRMATVASDGPIEAARKHPLTIAAAREQLGRLGDTPFDLGEVTLEGGGEQLPVMVPKSVMNDLRRRAVERLLKDDAVTRSHAIAEANALEVIREQIEQRWSDSPPSQGGVRGGSGERIEVRADVAVDEQPGFPNHPASSAFAGPTLPQPLPKREGSQTSLHILVRSMPQLESTLAWLRDNNNTTSLIYCEFEDIRKYKDAVARARAAKQSIALATTRVIKPHEEGLLKQLAACEPDAVLVRHLAGLSFFREHHPSLPIIADYSLNIANEITASIIAEQGSGGVARMVPSFDLNWSQMAALFHRFPPVLLEAVIHQHMPMFHMEHCVFCATLSNGKDFRDCGRPCDHHEVSLRDRVDADHPLVADVGCRNTVYNGTAQSAAEFVPRMIKLGIRHFRVELLREKAHEVAPLLDRYASVLRGDEDVRQSWRSLRVLNQLGVTRGTLGHE
ncbi:MAG: DUF3656 domain-containing protein [Phycisphaeraceae bacterium]